MISNERPSPFYRQPNRPAYYPSQRDQQPPRPFVPEDTLKSAEIQVERKTFILTLKENARGRFLRITEEGGSKRSCIIIPSTGLAEFKQMLDEMVAAPNANPNEAMAETAPVASVAPAPAPVVVETPAEASVAAPKESPAAAKPAKKTLSESARAKLSAAAKARWAKIKAMGKDA